METISAYKTRKTETGVSDSYSFIDSRIYDVASWEFAEFIRKLEDVSEAQSLLQLEEEAEEWSEGLERIDSLVQSAFVYRLNSLKASIIRKLVGIDVRIA